MLEHFTVIAQSETVGYEECADGEIYITWVQDGQDFGITAQDQDIVPSPHVPGLFTITDDEGDDVQFMAFTEASYEDLSAP